MIPVDPDDPRVPIPQKCPRQPDRAAFREHDCLHELGVVTPPPDMVGGDTKAAGLGQMIRVHEVDLILPEEGAQRSHENEGGQRCWLDGLANLFESAKPRAPVKRRSRRYGLAKRAHEMIIDQLTEPVSTRELAAELNVSARVLQYAFRDVFGTTPHKYAVARRLHAVRRDLRGHNARGVVGETARRYGFTELGRFSGLYRRMFGELPSKTRRS